MQVEITKPCNIVQNDGTKEPLKPGDFADVANDKGNRMMDAGYAKPAVFDAAHWLGKIERLADEMSAADPRDETWNFMIRERPELWRALAAASMEVDSAFEAQDVVRLSGAIQGIRKTFTACLEALNHRREYSQPELLAAV